MSINADLITLAKDVLLNYNINTDELNIIQNNGLKTLWKFNYKNETMCLKRLRHSKDRALFSVNAQIYVFNNGGHVPRIYLNKDKSPITEYNEQLFVLYEWIDGRNLSFYDNSDFKLAMEGLANFHIASKGYFPPEGAKISSKISEYNKQYESMKSRMLKWKDESSLKLDSSSYKSYFECVDEIIEIADMAIKELNNSSYDELSMIDNSSRSLCHQDYGEGNVLFTGKHSYVIDFDGVTFDFPVRDLRKIIGKQMQKKGEWKIEILKNILKFYEKNNKLSQQERELLKIDLLYPHWFFGEVKNLFKKNKLISGNKIQQIAKLEKSKINVLKNLF